MNMPTTKAIPKSRRPTVAAPVYVVEQSDKRLSPEVMEIVMLWLTDRIKTKQLWAQLGSVSLSSAIYKAGVGARQAVREGLLVAK